ncbi:MAG: DUF6941 family protein [Limisphaerales bacterium]
MTIQVAVLCDAATDYNGKLNLLGTFDTILAGQFPVLHPQCAVALRIMFDRMEEGHHDLKLKFVDEDGQLIMQNMDIPIDVSFPGDATFLSRNFIINFQPLKLEQAGLYSVDVSIDNRPLTSIPLAVRALDQPKPQE